jgi:hypothetical protein
MVIHETQKEKEYRASQSKLHRLFYVEWCRYDRVSISHKSRRFLPIPDGNQGQQSLK